MSSQHNMNQGSTGDSPGLLEWSIKASLVVLGFAACFYATMLFYHIATPVGSVPENGSILEQCRQMCLKYGLITPAASQRTTTAAPPRIAQN